MVDKTSGFIPRIATLFANLEDTNYSKIPPKSLKMEHEIVENGKPKPETGTK